jgi:type I restriction enzyme S subunit
MDMAEIREGYKETEIGVIPEDWEVKKLGEVVDVRDGTHDSPKQVMDGIPLITSKNLKEGRIDLTELTFISEDDHQNISKRSGVDNGDIIFAMIGTIGNPVIIDLDFDFSIKNVALLKFSKTNISNILVKNLLESRIIENQFLKNKAGGVQKFVSLKQIRQTVIPIPPLKEQEKIAEILSTTDKHIEDLDRLIEDYELLKKGMMQKLLTEGIGHTEFKDTEIGRIPKEWDLKSLGELGNTFNGLSGVTKIDFGSGKPYIPYKNIFSNTRVNMNSMDYVKVSGKKKQNKVKYGDVFFTTSSETPEEAGMSSVLLDDVEELYLNSFCFGFRLNDFTTLRPEFARYMLRSKHARKEISKLAQGSTRFNLSKNNVMKVQIPIPTILEQYKISEILDEFEITINQLKDSKDSYTNLKQALMDRLLTGKIRVV